MSVASTAAQSLRVNARAALGPVSFYLARPIRLFRDYDRQNLRPDLVAGITVAVILLPQAIAFTLIAELPPVMGIYAAIMGGIAGALWGSSDQMHTGPANAISLLVLSALSATAVPGTSQYIVAAGLMAVMVGAFQLFMGLARLGMLVNFVSHSVIVGFATGAAVLIGLKQIEPLIGLEAPGGDILQTMVGVVTSLSQANLPTVAVGLGTIALLIILNHINRKLPTALISMIAASAAVAVLHLDELGVATIGELPSGFPPLADLPVLNIGLISQLSAGALAVGAIGLVESAAIARSISSQTQQRLDSNQEFVGQGMANLLAGFFSGYAVAGSFSRSAVNFDSGARTPMAVIISCVFVLLAALSLGSLTRFLPLTALAGILIVTAVRMIDTKEIRRILNGTPGDAAIMVVTFFGTLFLHIEFAVLMGIMLSFVLYIMRTSNPRVQTVMPDPSFKHFTYQPDREPCPQLGIIEILGDLYFGAVNRVEEFILEHAARHPDQRYLLIRMHNVNHCDFSGIHMLENVVHTYRERGGDVYLVRVSYRVGQVMESTGFHDHLGDDHFIDEDQIISHLFYHVLDPAVCIYECPVRVFKECQNLPKRTDLLHLPLQRDIDTTPTPTVTAEDLWQRLHVQPVATRPLLIDVREPREYRQSHIPDARLIPLPALLAEDVDLPRDRELVFVCRTGRRSRRAVQFAHSHSIDNVTILQGGMNAWEAAGKLTAVDIYTQNGNLP